MEKFKILAIDGGGIRGVIPTIWVSKISDRLGGKDLHKHFDLIIGTSTGSIVAGAVAMNKDIAACLALYEGFGPKIFPRTLYDTNAWTLWERFIRPTYSDEPLGDALKQLFAIDSKLHECKTNTAIVSYDVFNRSMFLLRSYDEVTREVPIWEACKASSSAPTYFPAHVLGAAHAERPLIDGGVIANNPSMLGVAEAIRLSECQSLREFHRQNEIVLISLGTGSLQRKIKPSDAKSWGAMHWVRPLIDVLFDGTSELSNFCAAQMISPKNYARLQVDLYGVNDDMDDASLENIDLLKTLATHYADSDDGKAKLDKVADLLQN
jgi:patatin-like phospholipase/acyl hydrolase